jgi:hypothetical protein
MDPCVGCTLHSIENLAVAPITRKTMQSLVHISDAISEASPVLPITGFGLRGSRFLIRSHNTFLTSWRRREAGISLMHDETIVSFLVFPVAILANIPIIMQWHCPFLRLTSADQAILHRPLNPSRVLQNQQRLERRLQF